MNSFVYQPDMLCFVKQSLRAGIGAAVKRRGIPQLAFELPQVTARLIRHCGSSASRLKASNSPIRLRVPRRF